MASTVEFAERQNATLTILQHFQNVLCGIVNRIHAEMSNKLPEVQCCISATAGIMVLISLSSDFTGVFLLRLRVAHLEVHISTVLRASWKHIFHFHSYKIMFNLINCTPKLYCFDSKLKSRMCESKLFEMRLRPIQDDVYVPRKLRRNRCMSFES